MTTTFTRSDDRHGAEFVDADLRDARFVGADLSGVVMRGVEVRGADIDVPWLFDGETYLRVNGVDVIPLVEAELNRRFPGRALRRAGDPDGLRAAWATLERTWEATVERVAAMPASTEMFRWAASGRSRRPCGIWSLPRTRGWAGQSWGSNSHSTRSVKRTPAPKPTAWTCRSSRRSHPRTTKCSRSGPAASPWCVTSSQQSRQRSWPRRARTRGNPNTRRPPLSCLHVIFQEEWEHHRYAVRDLDAIEA